MEFLWCVLGLIKTLLGYAAIATWSEMSEDLLYIYACVRKVILWNHLAVGGSVWEPEADLCVWRRHDMGRARPPRRRTWAPTHSELSLRLPLTLHRLRLLHFLHSHSVLTLHTNRSVYFDSDLFLLRVYQAQNWRTVVVTKVETDCCFRAVDNLEEIQSNGQKSRNIK